MTMIHTLLFGLLASISVFASDVTENVYACNAPCVDMADVARNIATSLEVGDNFSLINLENGDIASYETYLLVDVSGQMVTRAKKHLTSEGAERVRGYFLETTEELGTLVIELPVQDENDIYRPLYSSKQLISEPQQRDFVAMSLEMISDVKSLPYAYIEALKREIHGVSAVKGYLNIRLQDGSTGQFQFRSHVSVMGVKTTIEYLYGSANDPLGVPYQAVNNTAS